MRIKRISIRDFGIFREEKIENLNSNIVIIGGYNRAGKSTFMEILRCIGFGFLKEERLSSVNIEYDVNCDIENQNKDLFNIEIKGNRQPIVKNINTKEEVLINDIYNLDYFTYKQIFTISLDELQNYSVKNSKELNNMYTVLLGAGFKEIAQIPEVIKELNKEASKIGGKNGNPTTAQFKEKNKTIKKGLELRKKALNEVEEYYKTLKELDKIQNNIKVEESNLKNLDKKINTIQYIKNNFKKYLRIQEIQSKLYTLQQSNEIKKINHGSIERLVNLKEEYEDVLHEYEEKVLIFRHNTKEDINFKNRLINWEEQIYNVFNNISGIKEKIRNYEELEKNCIEKRNYISKEMSKINEEWIDDFNKIKNIKTDILSLDNINGTIDNYNHLVYEKNLINNEISTLTTNKELIKESKMKNKVSDLNNIIKKYFFISILIVIFGLTISFVNYKVGIALIISGLILGGVYSVIIYSSTKENKINEGMESNIDNINYKLKLKTEKYKTICNNIESNEKKIQSFKELLNLKKDISGEILKEYFKIVKNIKNEIVSLESMISRAIGQKKEINSELDCINKLISLFNDKYKEKVNIKPEDFSQNIEVKFNYIEKLRNYVELAEKINIIEHKKGRLEEKILNLIGDKYKDNILNGIDEYIDFNKKYKEILELKTEKDMLDNIIKSSLDNESFRNYEELFKKYSSYSQVEEEYGEKQREFQSTKDKIESLKGVRQELQYKSSVLRTTEKLEEAGTYINEGRKELKMLAKKYAALKASEYILQKLQGSFIENKKDTLLKGASEYLSFITKGEYKDIVPPDNLLSLDFKTMLQDGKIKENPDILSRATKEQLFLSVRLSRIKEIEPHLPVILDDSLVNFDENHTKQALKILLQMSSTNQIFITTCHPQLVEYVGDLSSKVQYLKLEKGKFSVSSKEKLVKYLS
ncbi:AAA family ATPase [Clostridium sp. MB40-C1]|uniref:AAA family ATPase n=1 Tax=Clostridium sp. MB40-C1 TaxID=3070996 RepID=UPI0027E203BD|nr:AAA family ATPase [Clostridium sp. MB40-C1]WMJ80866.1 AAA family ATPase [Clostridium sp. MB40-C1]